MIDDSFFKWVEGHSLKDFTWSIIKLIQDLLSVLVLIVGNDEDML